MTIPYVQPEMKFRSPPGQFHQESPLVGIIMVGLPMWVPSSYKYCRHQHNFLLEKLQSDRATYLDIPTNDIQYFHVTETVKSLTEIYSECTRPNVLSWISIDFPYIAGFSKIYAVTSGVARWSAARGRPQKCRPFHPSNLLTRIWNERRTCFVLIKDTSSLIMKHLEHHNQTLTNWNGSCFSLSIMSLAFSAYPWFGLLCITYSLPHSTHEA